MMSNLNQAPDDWISAYAQVNAALATRTDHETPEGVMTLLLKSTEANWSAEKDVYVFGSLPAQEAIKLSQQNSLSWVNFRVFVAKASFGDLQGMRQLYPTLKEEHRQDALESAYRAIFVSEYHDERRRLSMDIVDQITAWGLPLPSGYLEDNPAALHVIDPEERARLMSGFNTEKILKVMKDSAAAEDSDTFSLFQEEMRARSGAVKMDNQHLVTTDYEPSRDGLGKLKKIFDFHAGRVLEIYQAPGTEQQVMTSVSFEEYNPNVIEEAREKLIALKGDPDSVTPFVKKRPLGLEGLKNGG